MYKVSELLASTGVAPEITAIEALKTTAQTKRAMRRVEAVCETRAARNCGQQSIGYSSRPFVLCGLPLRKPPKEQTVHERRNGRYVLRVIADPKRGLPFGQDRLIPIWIATMAQRTQCRVIRFSAGAEVLDTFGLQKDGKTYKRLIDGFWRVFYSQIYFGITRTQQDNELHAAESLRYIRRMALWESKHPNQQQLPGSDFENVIELSEEFWQEITEHPIPLDLHVVKALSDSPGALDFYVWLVYRSWTARKTENIPLFGDTGLAGQLGCSHYTHRPAFRQLVRRWIAKAKLFWPQCPSRLSDDANYLVIDHAAAIAPAEANPPRLVKAAERG